MRSEQDIEDERLMNFRYDRNYIGVYRFLIILGGFLVIIGLYSEIHYFTSTTLIQSNVVSKTKIGNTLKCEVVYEINDESYRNLIEIPVEKYNDSNILEIKIRKNEPSEIVNQEHFINIMLIIVGGVIFYYSFNKYKIEKRIDTSEEYKG